MQHDVLQQQQQQQTEQPDVSRASLLAATAAVYSQRRQWLGDRQIDPPCTPDSNTGVTLFEGLSHISAVLAIGRTAGNLLAGLCFDPLLRYSGCWHMVAGVLSVWTHEGWFGNLLRLQHLQF